MLSKPYGLIPNVRTETAMKIILFARYWKRSTDCLEVNTLIQNGCFSLLIIICILQSAAWIIKSAKLKKFRHIMSENSCRYVVFGNSENAFSPVVQNKKLFHNYWHTKDSNKLIIYVLNSVHNAKFVILSIVPRTKSFANRDD